VLRLRAYLKEWLAANRAEEFQLQVEAAANA